MADWIAERIDLGPLTGFLAKKTVPVHRHSWIYLLGGAALFLLAMQVASGCLLMLYYQPTEAAAHASVEKIMTDVPFGWLVRSMHAWGANLLIAAATLHFLTTLFTRAYRKPRELTWLAGMALLFLLLGAGFTGYLLPWTELSYFATLVGTQIPGAIPGVGEFLVHFLRGGAHVTGDTITRFYAGHVMIVPLAIAGVLGIHLLLVQFQGMSLPLGMAKKRVKDHSPFFTEFAIVDACVWLVLFAVIATLAVFLPPEIGAKADPLKAAPAGIKPEWYFLFVFQTLKHVPETLGVVTFGVGALFLTVLPMLDRNAGRERRSPIFTFVFVLLCVYAAVFQTWAWITPGMEHTANESAGLADLAGNTVFLVLLWAVVGFVVYYLRRLVIENARVRRLYTREDAEDISSTGE